MDLTSQVFDKGLHLRACVAAVVVHHHQLIFKAVFLINLHHEVREFACICTLPKFEVHELVVAGETTVDGDAGSSFRWPLVDKGSILMIPCFPFVVPNVTGGLVDVKDLNPKM